MRGLNGHRTSHAGGNSLRHKPHRPSKNGSAGDALCSWASLLVVTVVAGAAFFAGAFFNKPNAHGRQRIRESLLSQQLGGINAARAFDAAVHWNRTAESGDASGGSSGYTTVAGASAVSLADSAPAKLPVNVTGWAEELGLQNATVPGNGSLAAAAGQPQQREKIWLYIGIFSQGDAQTSKSGLRRRAIRQTWMPAVTKQPGMRARFVAGRPIKPSAIALFKKELDLKQDFLFLDFQECNEPDCSSRKLLAFFDKVTAMYEVSWIAKIDDAVYLSPQRLQLAARQWEGMHVEYIGCMKRAINIPSASQWQQKLQFDKDRMLLGYDDVLSAHEAAFVVSGAVVEEGLLPNRQHLRLFASADSSMGLWMVSFRVNFFDDMRLCHPLCHSAGVAFLNTGCAGLCDPVNDMHALHKQPECTSHASQPMPYLDSFFHNMQFQNLRLIPQTLP